MKTNNIERNVSSTVFALTVWTVTDCTELLTVSYKNFTYYIIVE